MIKKTYTAALNTKVDTLDISVATFNFLQNNSIGTVTNLIKYSPLDIYVFEASTTSQNPWNKFKELEYTLTRLHPKLRFANIDMTNPDATPDCINDLSIRYICPYQIDTKTSEPDAKIEQLLIKNGIEKIGTMLQTNAVRLSNILGPDNFIQLCTGMGNHLPKSWKIKLITDQTNQKKSEIAVLEKLLRIHKAQVTFIQKQLILLNQKVK